jgi:predicted phosphoribosyltransferase
MNQFNPRFPNRTEAGRSLADKLREYANRRDVIVFGLPRGGVPVAFEVAHALHVPLDVFVVRKLGVPWQPELAMGAIASGGVPLLNPEIVQQFGISEREVQDVIDREQRELERRERQYRGSRPNVDVHGKTVILVDDGLATGATMRAAVEALRNAGAERIVVAVPVSSPDTCDSFRGIADDVICAVTPEPFHAVGLWYQDFSPTTDQEVHDLLSRA